MATMLWMEEIHTLLPLPFPWATTNGQCDPQRLLLVFCIINTIVSANFWTMAIATTGGNIVIKAGWVRTEEPHTLWRWMASRGVDFYNNSRDTVSFMLPLSWSQTGPHAGCSSWNRLLLSPLDCSDSRSFTPDYCTSSQREWKSGRGSKATIPRG